MSGSVASEVMLPPSKDCRSGCSMTDEESMRRRAVKARLCVGKAEPSQPCE